jgi:hypothetical protein
LPKVLTWELPQFGSVLSTQAITALTPPALDDTLQASVIDIGALTPVLSQAIGFVGQFIGPTHGSSWVRSIDEQSVTVTDPVTGSPVGLLQVTVTFLSVGLA